MTLSFFRFFRNCHAGLHGAGGLAARAPGEGARPGRLA